MKYLVLALFLSNFLFAQQYCNGQKTSEYGYEYYPNAQKVKEYGYLYYPNGQKVKEYGYLYYPTGQKVKEYGYLYYPNGQKVKEYGYLYYPSGQKVKEYGYLYYPNGQKVKEYGYYYYPNGSKIGSSSSGEIAINGSTKNIKYKGVLNLKTGTLNKMKFKVKLKGGVIIKFKTDLSSEKEGTLSGFKFTFKDNGFDTLFSIRSFMTGGDLEIGQIEAKCE